MYDIDDDYRIQLGVCYVITEGLQEEHPDSCYYDDETGINGYATETCEFCKRICCQVHHQGYYCVIDLDNPLLPDEKKPFSFAVNLDEHKDIQERLK